VIPLILLSALLILFSNPASADLCDYYKKHSPGIYKINCEDGPSRAKRNTGSGASTFGGAFNINPSSIPTEPSPYGLETIGSGIPPGFTETNLNFSIIKGFHKIGSAVSTSGNNTFYGNDIIQRAYKTPEYKTFDPPEKAQGKLPTFNLGTAFELIEAQGSIPSLSLGVSLRHNQITDTFGWGTGVMIKSGIFVLGGGIAKEKVSNFLPEVTFYSATGGIRFLIFELEYSWLKNSGGIVLSPIQIMTLTANLGPIILSYAVRRAEFFSENGEIFQSHYAVQCQLNGHLSIGLLKNYIPGSTSFAMQIFL
jgi:hypothetical protein